MQLLVKLRVFQFHTGSIKRMIVIQNLQNICGFNSILVRLKGGTSVARAFQIQRFQFHTGSIKSVGVFIVWDR